jgi:hypothetical protein
MDRAFATLLSVAGNWPGFRALSDPPAGIGFVMARASDCLMTPGQRDLL